MTAYNNEDEIDLVEINRVLDDVTRAVRAANRSPFTSGTTYHTSTYLTGPRTPVPPVSLPSPITWPDVLNRPHVLYTTAPSIDIQFDTQDKEFVVRHGEEHLSLTKMARQLDDLSKQFNTLQACLMKVLPVLEGMANIHMMRAKRLTVVVDEDDES